MDHFEPNLHLSDNPFSTFDYSISFLWAFNYTSWPVHFNSLTPSNSPQTIPYWRPFTFTRTINLSSGKSTFCIIVLFPKKCPFPVKNHQKYHNFVRIPSTRLFILYELFRVLWLRWNNTDELSEWIRLEFRALAKQWIINCVYLEYNFNHLIETPPIVMSPAVVCMEWVSVISENILSENFHSFNHNYFYS